MIKARRWSSLPDAAQHLSSVCNERVSEADLLRFFIGGELPLSLRLVTPVKIRHAKAITPDDAKTIRNAEFVAGGYTAETAPLIFRTSLYRLPGNAFLQLDEQTDETSGVVEMLPYGVAAHKAESEHQILIGGPPLRRRPGLGLFIIRGGDIAQIVESDDDNDAVDGSKAQKEKIEMLVASSNGLDPSLGEMLLRAHARMRRSFLEAQRTKHPFERYFASMRFPRDAEIVIQTTAIRKAEELINHSEKPAISNTTLGAKERNTLLSIIAALCEHATIDHQARGVAPEIARMAGLIGVPLDPGTVMKVLKQIPDAVGTRQR